ncbi:MAG: flippase activity-associated protein Agl23 [Pyrinomonadaceae bacterium]
MTTGSTKSRASKGARAGQKAKSANNRPLKGEASARGAKAGNGVAQIDDSPLLSARGWQIASIAILAVALLLRLYDISLVPFHHDEGVNGNFLVRLAREGVYHYDPANYHGPTLYYFALVAARTFGLNDFAVRLVPALFGVATIWLVLNLRRRIGEVGALTAAALITVSPGAVYLSRYFIHETLFVFFTLGIVYAALRYYEEARPVYLFLASISAALLFATKETAMISVGVLIIALVTTSLYMLLRKSPGIDEELAARREIRAEDYWKEESEPERLARFGGLNFVLLSSLIAVAIFVVVYILFYSSFFTNWPKGFYDSLKTFQFWLKTGVEQHVHSWDTYLLWLQQEEAPIYVLGIVGSVWAVLKGRNRFAIFTGQWALGLLAAYSMVRYKTPWLTLNFIIPLAIIGGYAVQTLYEWCRNNQQRALVLTAALAAVAVCAYQTVQLNFRYYDDDRYAYVYAHTKRDLLVMMKEIERAAKRAGTNYDTGITITSPDYWPLPWYLRDYKHVGYFAQMTTTSEPIVIGRLDQDAQLNTMLGHTHQRISSSLTPTGAYTLRPGAEIVLYIRRDLKQ